MNDAARHAQTVRDQADELHAPAAVQSAYDRLAESVSNDYDGRNPLLLCVMIGGIVPMAELMRRLRFPFEVDYLHATRYRGETSGGELVWKVSPSVSLAGREVLIVDDILDEGHTLAAIQRALRAQQPATLRTLVLAEKLHDRRTPEAQADYIGLQVEDRYVFGCGMDYRNYWRQLPGIYAVKG